jgi:hypothetical protein
LTEDGDEYVAPMNSGGSGDRRPRMTQDRQLIALCRLLLRLSKWLNRLPCSLLSLMQDGRAILILEYVHFRGGKLPRRDAPGEEDIQLFV